jgi:2-dehydropantoate 2-reductase
MSVLVLGAGAVGLSVAAKLSAVTRVHVVCRKRYAEVVAKRGLVLSGIWGEGVYRFSAAENIPTNRDFSYILITTKAVDTEEICAQYADLLKQAEVVSLQNGIGNEEIISRYSDRVIGGTIITGFEWQGEGSIRVTVEAGAVKLGRFPHGVDPAVRDLVGLFNAAGIRAEESEQIQVDLWAKTLYNCALNPLGAIMEVPYGDLAHPDAWQIVESVVREVYAVLGKAGITLPWQDARAYLEYLGAYQLPATARHRSSMLQDIQNKRRTEIDFINGAVVGRARRYGLRAPVNETLARLIHFKESIQSGGHVS